MNHDDHLPDLSTLIDPELEARIVAWVSGEASPFEAAELIRLTNEKPELAIFQRRIAAVSGLISEAIRPDQAPLRLSPDRRTKLLQALDVTESKTSPTTSPSTVVLPMAATNKKQRKDRRWLYGLAACLTVGLFTVMSIPSFQKMRYAETRKSMALKTIDSRMEPVAADWAQSKQEEKESYDHKDHEMASKYAAVDAATRTQEGEAEKKALSARDAASPRATNQVAQQKFRQTSAQKRTYGAIRYDSTMAKVDSGLNLQTSPVSPPAPANKRIVFDLPNPSSPAGTPVPSDLKTLGAVVPRQFKYDVDAQNSNERLVFSGSAEGGGAKANWGPSRGKVASSPRAGYINAPTAPSAAEAHTSIRASYERSGLAKTGADSEKIALSPFTVEADHDHGYAAKDTLAGTRINTNLTDKGSAITVVTKEFLDDLSATNAKYSLAAKVTETRGNRASQDGKEVDTPSADLPLEKMKAPTPVQTFTEINAAKEPVSTFSLHVSDVSFHLAQAALAKDEAIDRASIRPEEFYNAFSYGDPTPALAEKVSCRIEQAAHPFAQQRNLVRIAVKVAAAGRDAAQPLHLTVLLDTSGSMEREDRAATIQSAMKALTSLLGSNDRLTLIGFSRQPRLLAESLAGDQAAQVLDLIKNTPAEGGTNLEEALKLGSELAHRQFEAGAQNRIVLLTDGAANLGNANPAQLAASIEALRQQGIAFDACGVGLEGLDDGMLENLTRKGDGRYYVLNSPEAADAGFAKQLAGAFRPAAENVKLQVRFNPARVGHYRLIGFEQHRLREEDFRNDKVDAAELAAEEAAVAVYQVEALPQGEGELGEVYVRFRDTASGNMVERNWTLNYDAQAPAFDRATPTIQLAGVSALLAEKLQGGEAAAAINLGDLAPIVNKLRSHYANEPRVQELVTMFEQARKLAGE